MTFAWKSIPLATAIFTIVFACHAQDGEPAPEQSAASAVAAPPDTLVVCADPDNLPFSNMRGEGFENRIASLIAADLGLRVAYAWSPQRRNLLRHTLAVGRCDLVVGLPVDVTNVETTRPYYRSTYVFVFRVDRDLGLRDFDDARLRTLSIGVSAVSDAGASVAPSQALAARGIVANLHPYAIQSGEAPLAPERRLLDAVSTGEVDVGLAWGPSAGWFARFASPSLRVVPVPRSDRGVPMTVDIAMGVRAGDVAMRDRVQQAIDHVHPRIDEVLRSYGVPLVPIRTMSVTSRVSTRE